MSRLLRRSPALSCTASARAGPTTALLQNTGNPRHDAWRRYRNGHCERETDFEGRRCAGGGTGSLYPLVPSSTSPRLTGRFFMRSGFFSYQSAQSTLLALLILLSSSQVVAQAAPAPAGAAPAPAAG